MGNLLGESLMSAYDKIFGVYQDWVHHNPGTHVDGGIEEDGKWQEMWNKLVFMPIQHYDVSSSRIGNKFVEILSVELDRIRNLQWNKER